jgi:RNA polymerase sigma-70 factor (ECF subfamily)
MARWHVRSRGDRDIHAMVRTEAASSASGAELGSESGAVELPAEERELAALQAGDDRAFERLVRAHVGRLHAVALRLLQNPADADEVVQEGFLSAYRNLPSFRGEARLETWLHRIVVNAALQRLRRRKHRIESAGRVEDGVDGTDEGMGVDVDELLPRFSENGYPEHFHRPWVQTTEELATRAETREQVRRMIDKLPDNYRTVLILRDIEELDTSAVSELLELTPGTVKVRLHRARQALRNLLEHEFELTRQA